MIYDRKLSSTIAKEKQRVQDGKLRWNGKRNKEPRRKKDPNDPRQVICVNCPHMGDQFRCIRCPLYKTADGSMVRVK